MDSPGTQAPLWQDLDQTPGSEIGCDCKVREHGEAGPRAHGFAHGERGIEKNGSLHIDEFLFGLVQ